MTTRIFIITGFANAVWLLTANNDCIYASVFAIWSQFIKLSQ